MIVGLHMDGKLERLGEGVGERRREMGGLGEGGAVRERDGGEVMEECVDRDGRQRYGSLNRKLGRKAIDLEEVVGNRMWGWMDR